jgi:spore coat protein U-like protein
MSAMSPIVRMVLLCLLGLLALLPLREAEAASCTASMTSIVFAGVDPLSSQTDATATLHYTCQAGLLPENFTACFSIGDGVQGGGNPNPRRMLDGAARPLWFQLYQNAARTTIWGSTTFGSNTPVKLNLSLGILGSTSGNITLYGRVSGGQASLVPGTYQNTFSGSHTLITINNGLFSPPNTCSALNFGNSFPFTASAIVTANCSVNANALNFGTAGPLLANADSTSSIGVQCTSGVAYQVGLNDGQHAAGTVRRMSGPGGLIAYELYRNSARTLRWGATPGNTVLGSGNGSTQNFTAYGRVPAQATPAAGVYTDTIVVTVTY